MITHIIALVFTNLVSNSSTRVLSRLLASLKTRKKIRLVLMPEVHN